MGGIPQPGVKNGGYSTTGSEKWGVFHNRERKMGGIPLPGLIRLLTTTAAL